MRKKFLLGLIPILFVAGCSSEVGNSSDISNSESASSSSEVNSSASDTSSSGVSSDFSLSEESSLSTMLSTEKEESSSSSSSTSSSSAGNVTLPYDDSRELLDLEHSASELTYHSAQGYVSDMTDFSVYEGTNSYVKVSNPKELLEAIKLAKYSYTSQADRSNITENRGYQVCNNVRKNEANWTKAITNGLFLKSSDGTYTQIPSDTPFSDESYNASMVYYEINSFSTCGVTQELTEEGKVHVIEITADLNMGWNKLSAEEQAIGIAKNFNAKAQTNEATYTMSSMFSENGISQIYVENISNLLIYSKNGSKITHGGFKVTSCYNVAFRNLEFDEMWQWEDSKSTSAAKIGDYDAFGWAYFKIGFSDNIWIDHCTFGKSYDGQIDISNPTYNTIATAFRAPYGADVADSADCHISWCKFNSGSDDKNGYLYKMMEEIENDYQTNHGANYRYYTALRDSGVTFEEILYGIAIPQKKAFLDCDTGDEFFYNYNLRLSIANCYFKNVEDRIPNIRGGVVYMYDTLVDCFQYYYYRAILKNRGAANTVFNVNSTWKCGLVSQAMIAGNGGSVCANNCIFRGVDSPLKNNNSGITNNSQTAGATTNGGYKLINCKFQLTKDSEVTTTCKNSNTGTLKEEFFTWRTQDGNAPFEPSLYEIDHLETELLACIFKAGTLSCAEIDFVKVKY